MNPEQLINTTPTGSRCGLCGALSAGRHWWGGCGVGSGGWLYHLARGKGRNTGQQAEPGCRPLLGLLRRKSGLARPANSLNQPERGRPCRHGGSSLARLTNLGILPAQGGAQGQSCIDWLI